MTERREISTFQEFLDDVSNEELRRHPDIETDADEFVFVWDNLYTLLGNSDARSITNLTRIIGAIPEQISQLFKLGMQDQNGKKRLNRVFACASIWTRIYEDKDKLKTELSIPQPSLHNRTPIMALKSGDIDKVLYFAAMSNLGREI